MLGNEVELWEILLAACKLGAVIIPAATLLRTEDLRDRLDRGEVRHVIAGAAHTSHFTALGGDYTRISVGGESPGWQASTMPGSSPPRLPRMVSHARTIHCFCTSPQARPLSRSLSRTRIRAIRWATYRRCTGSACSPAMCIGTSVRRVGRNTPGAVCLRRGTQRPRCSRTTTRASMRRTSCRFCPPRESRRSALRRQCGACSSRRSCRTIR